MGQTQRVLSALLERPIGMLGDGKKDVQEMTVSTIQTASRLSKAKEFRKYLESVPVLIGDEVHLVGARGMWVDVTKRTPAYVKVGFTATALRRHDRRRRGAGGRLRRRALQAAEHRTDARRGAGQRQNLPLRRHRAQASELGLVGAGLRRGHGGERARQRHGRRRRQAISRGRAPDV